ncbi:MAG TPA: N-formylglutamate amidohydrolase [Prolixibacteraceae bacterium]|nr:N-formylglutamate amidohydrolase [Prolixibacteraceae bacterium]
MLDIYFDIKKYSSPLLTIAVHNGHQTRDEIKPYLNLNEYERLREEDPYTEFFTHINGNKIIVNNSRFEVDLNRPRNLAVYKTPENSWGLKVWKDSVPKKIWENSLYEYDNFYNFLKSIIDEIINAWGFIIVYDIHSYNHLREKAPASANENPEVNVGTGSLNQKLWKPVTSYFINSMKESNYLGRKLDVRENVKFEGGHLSFWIHKNYPGKSCVLAIELKKIFMDEKTGAADIHAIRAFKDALSETVPGVVHEAHLVMQTKNRPLQLPDLRKRKKKAQAKSKNYKR